MAEKGQKKLPWPRSTVFHKGHLYTIYKTYIQLHEKTYVFTKTYSFFYKNIYFFIKTYTFLQKHILFTKTYTFLQKRISGPPGTATCTTRATFARTRATSFLLFLQIKLHSAFAPYVLDSNLPAIRVKIESWPPINYVLQFGRLSDPHRPPWSQN